MSGLTKKQIVSRLFKGPIKVTFVKADGSIREMFCAMYENKADYVSSNTNDNLVTVFDAMAQGIRSFKVDSVINVEDVTHDESDA